MTNIPVFKALVTPECRVILRETERARRQQWLQAIAGRPVEIVIRPERQQRTTKQNAFIHAGLVLPVAHEIGDDPDDVKADMMRACWGSLLNDDGVLESWIGHTSSMDTAQGQYFIEWAPPWALRMHGIELPLPGEVEIYR